MDKFAGVGESKLHGGVDPIERGEWTIDGKKVPTWLNVPFDVTDQGIAEKRAKLEAEGRLADFPVKITADASDKRGGAVGNPSAAAYARAAANPTGRTSIDPDAALAEYRDRGFAGVDPLENPDAMEQLMREHVPPGFRGRFLSPAVCQERGTRGWMPVQAPDGKGGTTQVKVGNMFLGIMPEDRARTRENAALEANVRQISRSVEDTREKLERAGVDASSLQRVAKRHGQEADGVKVEHGEYSDTGRDHEGRGIGGEVDLDSPGSARVGNFEVTM